MRTITTIAGMRAAADERRPAGGSIGFVPTMGFLHEGHLSLITRARAESAFTVVSIYVNPLQFGPGEDFEAYPRDAERDAATLEEAGVDVLFAPTVEEMRPEGFATSVEVGGLGDIMCGAFRPGHFRGVATIVTKLLDIVGQCRAYFGEKDYQQLVVARRLVEDLALPVEVVGCPTVREPDGLAMSSRNAYLDRTERTVAPVLHLALSRAAKAVAEGEADAVRVRDVALEALGGEPLFAVEYVEVRDAEDLAELDVIDRRAVIAVAGYLGRARLIDNVVATPPARP